jgi:hypothetical protein
VRLDPFLACRRGRAARQQHVFRRVSESLVEALAVVAFLHPVVQAHAPYDRSPDDDQAELEIAHRIFLTIRSKKS